MRNLFRNISKKKKKGKTTEKIIHILHSSCLNLRDSHLPSGQIFALSGLDNFD